MALADVVLGGAVSLIVVLSLLIVLDRVIDRAGRKPAFRRILKDPEGFYSLTHFQFFVWTIVFIFSLVWVYAVRIEGGVLGYITAFPTATLALMGINTASAFGSTSISVRKSTEPQEKMTEEQKELRKKFWGMLYADIVPGEHETDQPDLSRVQFFLWTVVSVLIYLTILLAQMLGPYLMGFPSTPLSSLAIPDVDPSLVILMGLSQGAYVGVKYVKNPPKKKTVHITSS